MGEGERVLIVGGGSREHALGWKLGQSPKVSKVFYAPGNGGTEEEKGENVPIDGTKEKNFDALYDFIKQNGVTLVIPGPEAPLAAGLVDRLNAKGFRRVFAPTRRHSRLEADKFFSFDTMKELKILQADAIKCYSTEEAVRAINEMASDTKGVVIKARGLTGGKGVTVCSSRQQALNEIRNHAEKYGPEVLISEKLFGEEFTVLGICGKRVLPFGISMQDHKPLLDGDNGPNTGGMGAYCPAPIASDDDVRKIGKNILTPVIRAMSEMEIDGQRAEYRGFVYAGMMMTFHGPKVLEFNIRLGDPETQPLMMKIKRGLYEAIARATDEGLDDRAEIEYNPGAACGVVIAVPGYPGEIKKRMQIDGIYEANKLSGVKVFHGGTKRDGDIVRTDGGRVVTVTALSEGLTEAQKSAYAAASIITIEGGTHYRRDIAQKGIDALKRGA